MKYSFLCWLMNTNSWAQQRTRTHRRFWWKGNYHVSVNISCCNFLVSPWQQWLPVASGTGAGTRVLRVSKCVCDSCNEGKIPWLWVALSKHNTHENNTPYHTESGLFSPCPILLFHSRLLTFVLIPDDLRFKKETMKERNRQKLYLKLPPFTVPYISPQS